MFPKPPSWVVRSNEWASLGQWGYLLVTFSLGSAATLWFGPNHEVGWGAVVWGGAFFAIVVALAAALSAHAYATFRGRSGVAQAAEPGRQAGDLDRPAPGLVAAGAQAAREREAGLSQEASANPEKPEALTAKRELSMFLTSYLLPACSSIRKLHFAIMQQICGENKLLLDLADQGFEQHRDSGKFHETLGKLGIWSSSGHFRNKTFSTLDEMADTLRFYYPAYCDFCDKLCKPASIDYKNHPELRAVWLEWKSKHNALIPEYDKIKVDPLLNRFYRSADSKDFGVLLETE